MTRIYNFNAGPAVLPIAVLEEAREHLLELPGSGVSILEMSHRSPAFTEIIEAAEADLRVLLQLPKNYQVLFLQGGASLQFSMAPLNLLHAGANADYLLSGDWGKKAFAEAQKVARSRGATVRVAASTESGGFRRVPQPEEIQQEAPTEYLHFTSNETIHGVQWPHEPRSSQTPLVCDASSDILSRPLDIEKYGLIYAGAQKNMGPSGVTLVIIRDDLLQPTPPELPTMLDYKIHAAKKSLYNTPNTFGIYIIGLVCRWLRELGGLTEMAARNQDKAALLYDVIDRSEFFRGHAEPSSRSLMNVTFRLPNAELEKRFVQQAEAAGMIGLKGHRDVGGLRASIYNAFPREGVQALADFMREFERNCG